MEKLFGILALFVFVTNSFAQETSQRDAFGIELDAFPYLTGGYYLSGWYAKNQFKLRGVYASVNVPEFAIKQGFKDHSLSATAIILDYFPKPERKGAWYGAGLEFWSSEIKSKKENSSSKFENMVLTVGTGYVWYFHKHLYLNPWAALHLVASGDNKVQVGNDTYSPDIITGEVSLKLGFEY